MTGDVERGKRIARQIDTSMVFINGHTGPRRICLLAGSRTQAMAVNCRNSASASS